MASPAVTLMGRIGWKGRPSPEPVLYKEGDGRNDASQSFVICLSPFLLLPLSCHGERAW